MVSNVQGQPKDNPDCPYLLLYNVLWPTRTAGQPVWEDSYIALYLEY